MGNAADKGVYRDICYVAALSKNRRVLYNDICWLLQAYTGANYRVVLSYLF